MSDNTDLVTAIGNMEESITDAIKKLAEREGYDKELSETFKQYFTKTTEFITKFKAIDLTPMVNIASDISKQNVSILDLVGRLTHTQDNSKLIALVTDMVGRNIEFIQKALPQTVNYSEELKEIAAAIKQENSKIKEIRITRGFGGVIDKVTPIY